MYILYYYHNFGLYYENSNFIICMLAFFQTPFRQKLTLMIEKGRHFGYMLSFMRKGSKTWMYKHQRKTE